MKIDHTLTCTHEWRRDSRITRKARGLLAEVLSYTTADHLTVDRLVDLGCEGRAALLTAFKELEAVGYVIRERTRSANGTWTVLTCVYACPYAACENRLGIEAADPTKLGHRKLLVDTSAKSDTRPVPESIFDSGLDQPINGSTRVENRTLIDVRAVKNQSQDLNVASMRGAKPTTSPVDAVHTRIGEAENPLTVVTRGAEHDWAWDKF